MTTVKAILIDPEAKLVSEVMVENTLEAYYALIRCQTIEAAYPRGLKAADYLYVDEEGLFDPSLKPFVIQGYEQPLLGRALVVGHDDSGDTADVATTLKEIVQRVRFS